MRNMTADQAIASINAAKAEIDAMMENVPAQPAPEQSHAAILRRLQAEKAAARRASSKFGPGYSFAK
jgi:hypothetical protein